MTYADRVMLHEALDILLERENGENKDEGGDPVGDRQQERDAEDARLGGDDD